MNILSLPRRELDKTLNIFFHSFTDVRFWAIGMLRDGSFYEQKQATSSARFLHNTMSNHSDIRFLRAGIRRPSRVLISRTTQRRSISSIFGRFRKMRHMYRPINNRIDFKKRLIETLQSIMVGIFLIFIKNIIKNLLRQNGTTGNCLIKIGKMQPKHFYF